MALTAVALRAAGAMADDAVEEGAAEEIFGDREASDESIKFVGIR
jgi:hypothetical protein